VSIRVANAPVSFGAFELTVGRLPNVPGPEEVLAAVAAAGYEGTELGPPGYLGAGEVLRERLERHGLALAGGYIPLRLTEPERWEEDLAALAQTLDIFAAADGRDCRPVLADAGPAGALPSVGWRRFADGVARAAAAARSRGFEPTFHHHMGTHVESAAQIERLLELTDIGLVLDTGHLLLGGGDPLEGLRAWRERIDHVHVKDAVVRVLEEIVREGAEMEEVWRRGAFCELGGGDVDLRAFLDELRAGNYSGWVVVEQDRIPAVHEDPSEAFEAQARNRRWLAEHGGI
jgi:inosose dehydratase